jgi:hypothetical protein
MKKFHYLMYMQFKFEVRKKIQRKEKLMKYTKII